MSSKVVTLTADNFDQLALAGDRVALVEFGANWCPPCRALAPSVHALAEERQDLLVGTVDVDDHPAIAARYGVANIPTVIVFRGGQVSARCVGLVPLGHLRELASATGETATEEAMA